MLQTKNAPSPKDPFIGNETPESPQHGLRSKILLLLASTIFSLILVEIAVRALAPVIAPEPVFDRPKWSYLPESSRDDRNAAFQNQKPAGTFRIVAVGDSFTFAGKVQYDDNFAKRLERMLNLNNEQRKVEVLDWGIPGISTAEEAPLVRNAMEDYQADLVVLEITLNDPELEPYHASHASFYQWEKTVESGFLFRHWHTLQLLARRLLNTVRTREYLSYHHELFTDEKTWGSFSKALEKIKRASTDTHVPIVAMIFPMLSHSFDEGYPFRAEHAKITARLNELGIPGLDLLPSFAGLQPERLQAKPGKDAHPNEIGHRIAAESLYMFLTAQNLLPPDVLIKNRREKGRRLPKSIARFDKMGGEDD